ncbi:MAG: CHAT domain-containing protein, partial [Chloroflexi bacterium]|nr:CHAT domain-containing protein [Chloroflexota bacterium]
MRTPSARSSGSPPMSTTQLTYTDLEVRLRARESAGFPVEITYVGEIEFPIGYLRPDCLPWVPTASRTADGERLFGLLFGDPRLREAWSAAVGPNAACRIRLRIDDSAPELNALPWELLREPLPGGARDLAADERTPLSRYLAGIWQHGAPILDRPIRLLIAIAAPSDLDAFHLPPIVEATELQVINQATAQAPPSVLRVEPLPPPVTLSGLEDALRHGYHALHLVCHGRISAIGEPQVYLCTPENTVTPVNDVQLAEMIGRQRGALRLVVLESCHTASADPTDAFRGFAPRLVGAGVPAVVAMQGSVSVPTARTFMAAFYRGLMAHGCVDRACNGGRSSVLTAGLQGAATPVLYMRLRNGVLFAERGEVLGRAGSTFWQTLIENIADKQCTPFLGPGITEGLLPSPQEVARRLADLWHYPFGDRENLPRVAQYQAVFDKQTALNGVLELLTKGFCQRAGLPPPPREARTALSRVIGEAGWPEIARTSVEGEPHRQLADLGLPLYLTTNYDNLLALALEGPDRRPRRVPFAWRDVV